MDQPLLLDADIHEDAKGAVVGDEARDDLVLLKVRDRLDLRVESRRQRYDAGLSIYGCDGETI